MQAKTYQFDYFNIHFYMSTLDPENTLIATIW